MSAQRFAFSAKMVGLYLSIYALFIFAGKLKALTSFVLPQQLRFTMYTLLFIAGVLLLRHTLQQNVAAIRKHPVRSIFLLIAFYVFNLLLSLVVYFVFQSAAAGGINDENIFQVMLRFSPWITLPVLGVMGPIVEEFVYRYILIGRLSQKVPVWLCVLLSSVLFGLLHIHSLSDIIHILPYFATGLVLGLLYVASGYNLLLPIAFHVFNNMNGLIPFVLQY
ncbi:type II CAAX endopeptidase family protein [Saccharibacillus sacchari]|uniref:Type II CAAX endopeptidase family protein n=1 Tax=Saccharibacillus sacchari TaxID=456493 RepID=A0ACC6PK56_9BACL